MLVNTFTPATAQYRWASVTLTAAAKGMSNYLRYTP